MTLPSTEKLQELLRSTTPGPWDVRQHYDDGTPRPDESAQLCAGDDYLGIMQGLDADLTALAPELAEEVIRLRKELGAYINHLNDMADKDRHTPKSALDAIASALNRILNGEK